MKYLDLKAKVFSLANVQNSQDLKRCYPIARSFNLSCKKSWEDLLLEFQTTDKPEQKTKPKIGELKAQVFRLAGRPNRQSTEAKLYGPKRSKLSSLFHLGNSTI